MPQHLNLTQAIDLAEDRINKGHAAQAIDLLREFLPRHGDDAGLHLTLGRAHHEAGDSWQALAHRHKAQKLRRDPDFWIPLMIDCLHLDLSALALDASRRAIQEDLNHAKQEVGDLLAWSEEKVQAIAVFMGLAQKRAEEGLRFFEEGQIALHTGDYPGCIKLNRRALQILGPFTPCINNLSIAQFFYGYPQEAIRSANQVLELDPENVHALANMIRFLSWIGLADQALVHWQVLKSVDPGDTQLRMKIIEAAAMMEEDDYVWDLLKDMPARQQGGRSFDLQLELMRAVCAANLGLPEAADLLGELSKQVPYAEVLLEAFVSGKPGPGWAARYPYFHSSQLLPDQQINAFLDLLKREPDMPPKRFRKEVQRFADRFPQLVLFAEKTILEDGVPDAGIPLLATIATPEAYEVLRRIGLGQVGSEELRMDALVALQRAGKIPADEPVKFWLEDEWREIRLLDYEIGGGRDLPYREEVNLLLERAAKVNLEGDEDRAIDLYEQVLREEPRAKEAYNNLASIYAYRSEHEKARELFERALDLDPAYIIARCNKAIYLMDDGELGQAEALIMPAFERHHMHAQEYAFLCFTRARMHYLRDELKQALHLLELALEVDPEYEPALDLIDDIEWEVERRLRREGWRQEQAERDRRKRRKLQSAIGSDAPDLEKALGVHTKDSLTEIARTVDLEPGWSTLKKAELIRRIAHHLSDARSLANVIDALKPVEKKALGLVMQREGVMGWEDFDAEFGNDLEESQYWRFNPPESVMGRLRLHGLIAEATVAGELLIVIPLELRGMLSDP